MKVLVLGGAGYIGAVLCEYLESIGDEVIVMDNFLYERNLKNLPKRDYIVGDIRNINDLLPAIEKADAVVNLAAISNDPASDLLPELTWNVNYKANHLIAELCQASGKRVIYASSCSVYGFSENGEFNEDSPLGPVTLYARTKMLSEKPYLTPGVDSIVLRFATVYGHSPKPRFDLVVNTMTGNAYFKNKIVVNGGSQWRPIVHVKDVSRAIGMMLHVTKPKHQIYNVGSNEQNYRIADLGRLVKQELPAVELIINEDSIDGRSYKANFDRIRKDFGFRPVYDVKDAVKEIYAAFANKSITSLDEDVYYRVKYLMKHTRNGEKRKGFFGKSLATLQSIRSINLFQF
jgi:nucleoside-diphosphate-sugar epimerase